MEPLLLTPLIPVERVEVVACWDLGRRSWWEVEVVEGF